MACNSVTLFQNNKARKTPLRLVAAGPWDLVDDHSEKFPEGFPLPGLLNILGATILAS